MGEDASAESSAADARERAQALATLGVTATITGERLAKRVHRALREARPDPDRTRALRSAFDRLRAAEERAPEIPGFDLAVARNAAGRATDAEIDRMRNGRAPWLAIAALVEQGRDAEAALETEELARKLGLAGHGDHGYRAPSTTHALPPPATWIDLLGASWRSGAHTTTSALTSLAARAFDATTPAPNADDRARLAGFRELEEASHLELPVKQLLARVLTLRDTGRVRRVLRSAARRMGTALPRLGASGRTPTLAARYGGTIAARQEEIESVAEARGERVPPAPPTTGIAVMTGCVLALLVVGALAFGGLRIVVALVTAIL